MSPAAINSGMAEAFQLPRGQKRVKFRAGSCSMAAVTFDGRHGHDGPAAPVTLMRS